MDSLPHQPATNKPEASTVGHLRVELPHWTAKVNISDNLYMSVPQSSLVVEPLGSSGIYTVEASLSPGIYKVEVSLADKTESQLVVVRSQQTSLIAQKEWSTLLSASTVSLTAATEPHPHIVSCEETSHKLTWTDGAGGDSRLFLFIRTPNPDDHPSFGNGLQLLTLQGEVITDFTTGVKQDVKSGWLAFNADLPAGYYILRRGRSGVRIRHQALYLCSGWETQVFLVSRHNYPSISSMSMNMVPRGTGFHADSETAVAAEVVFDYLRRGSNEAGPVAREKITTLLEGKSENPWLSILAAYALLRDRNGGAANATNLALLNHVLSFLNNMGDHPDVRALQIKDDEPTDPFWYPPLLRDGLKRVQRHAMRFVTTVPLQSLTDIVLDQVMVDSPWVAWRQLQQRPIVERDHSQQIAAFEADFSQPEMGTTKSMSLPRHAASSELSYTEAFVKGGSPRAPVYRLPSSAPSTKAQSKAQSAAVQSSYGAPATISTVQQAPLIQMLQELTLTTDTASLPERITLNSAQSLNDMLADVTPSAISAASGLPLSRTEYGLEGLRRAAIGPTSATSADAPDEQLTADERSVFEYMVQKSGQSRRLASRGLESAAPVGVESDSPAPAPHAASFTIEECVAKLQIEADRLLSMSKAEEQDAQAEALAARLRKVAENLLSRADFIIVTDPSGQMLYANGAFLSLLAPTEELRAASIDDLAQWRQSANEEWLAHQRAWEAALASVSSSQSILADPLKSAQGRQWMVRRTIIEDDATHKEQAYLNILHYPDTAVLTLATLQVFKERVPSLTLNSSMYVHSPDSDKPFYLSKLETLTAEFEKAINTKS